MKPAIVGVATLYSKIYTSLIRYAIYLETINIYVI